MNRGKKIARLDLRVSEELLGALDDAALDASRRVGAEVGRAELARSFLVAGLCPPMSDTKERAPAIALVQREDVPDPAARLAAIEERLARLEAIAVPATRAGLRGLLMTEAPTTERESERMDTRRAAVANEIERTR